MSDISSYVPAPPSSTTSSDHKDTSSSDHKVSSSSNHKVSSSEIDKLLSQRYAQYVPSLYDLASMSTSSYSVQETEKKTEEKKSEVTYTVTPGKNIARTTTFPFSKLNLASEIFSFLYSVSEQINLSPSGLAGLTSAMDRGAINLDYHGSGSFGDTFTCAGITIKIYKTPLSSKYQRGQLIEELAEMGIYMMLSAKHDYSIMFNYSEMVSTYPSKQRLLISWYEVFLKGCLHLDIHKGNIVNGRLVDFDNILQQIYGEVPVCSNTKYYHKGGNWLEMELRALCDVLDIAGFEIGKVNCCFSGSGEFINVDYDEYQAAKIKRFETQAGYIRMEYKFFAPLENMQ